MDMRYLLILLSMPCCAQDWGRYNNGMPIAPPNLSQMQTIQMPAIWAYELRREKQVSLPPAKKGDFVTPPNVGENRLIKR